MVSISKAKSAKAGMSYFEEDSYYAKKNEHGQWFGNYVTELGIEGGIERNEFMRILDGCDLEGNALVRNAMSGKRRSYVDFTFSCPKSASVLSYSDPRIEQAHNAAVTRALLEIQSNYAITREGAGGCESYRTDNIIAARFNHHESRELDPQLHSHCVIMNMTKGQDGKYRALEMGEMFRNQLYIGQVYRNEFSKQLRRLGYNVEITDRQKGLFEIAGVDKEIIDEFSTRRRQILEIMKDCRIDYPREGKRAEQACLLSRKRKTQTSIEEIRARTQEKLREFGTTLDDLKAQALRISDSASDAAKVSKADCIAMALEDLTEHQSAFKKEQVLALALKNGLGMYSPDEIRAEFEKNKELRVLGTKHLFIGKTVSPDVRYFTTKEIEEVERGILRLAEKHQGRSAVQVSVDFVKKFIQTAEKSGIDLSKGQKEAIEMVCTSKNFMAVVQGDAGAGKTFGVEQIRRIMEQNGFKVRGFAPTAKAAVELQSAGIQTATVDSFLVSKKEDVTKGELWVVDESGMMGSRKLRNFLLEAEKHKAKVVLIGDSKQFTAVEQGKMFSDLQKHPATGYAEITEVRRQKTDHMKEIVADFKKRNVEGVQNAFERMQKEGCVNHIADREQRLASVARDYLKDREQKKECLVLSATNRDRNDLNKNIRRTLVERNIVHQGSEHTVLQNAGISGNNRRFANSYKVGQQIFFQKKSADIERGTQADITAIDIQKNTISIKYADRESSEGVERTVDLFKESVKIQAFNVDKRNFGVGDSIITLKNDKLLGVENGKIGTIKNIDKAGNVEILFTRRKIDKKDAVFNEDAAGHEITVVPSVDLGPAKKGAEYRVSAIDKRKQVVFFDVRDDFGNPRRASIGASDLANVELYRDTKSRFNMKKYAYCDHAYAVTTYKSQGATLDFVRWCHDHTQKTNYNEAYVAITRARLNAVVYTSDPAKLVVHAAKEQEKHSILDFDKLRKARESADLIESDFQKDKREPIHEHRKELKREATYGLEI